MIGFGLGGQNLARVLKSREIPFVAIESNAVAVRTALRLKQPVVYGDATRPELLHSVDIANAKLVVVAISDAIATREIVARTREISPSVPILARTRFVLEGRRARASRCDSGRSVEELEATLELIGGGAQGLSAFRAKQSRALPRNCAKKVTSSLRTPEVILDPWLSELLEGVASQWVEVPESLEGDPSLLDLAVRARTGATIVAIERQGSVTTPPEPTFRLRAGDRLLALGNPGTIERLTTLAR